HRIERPVNGCQTKDMHLGYCFWHSLLGLIAAASIAGISGSCTDRGRSAQRCTPDSSRSCVCDASALGSQICNKEGGFTECNCKGTGSSQQISPQPSNARCAAKDVKIALGEDAAVIGGAAKEPAIVALGATLRLAVQKALHEQGFVVLTKPMGTQHLSAKL